MRCVQIHISCISMYAVLINSDVNINSRQLIGSNRDTDGYGVVALISALKWPLQEMKG
jgi:hypothetical protein